MPENREGGQSTQRSGQPKQETDQNIRNQDQQRDQVFQRDQGGQRNKDSENEQGRSGNEQQKR